ncbi:UNVERIFIED_CONTAM: hypothetical protein FKN15_025550 [Acipenser sinensis]
MYEETMTCYNIANKISGIVADAANMVKAFTMFPPSDVQDTDTDQDVSTDVVDLVDRKHPEVLQEFEATISAVLSEEIPVGSLMPDPQTMKWKAIDTSQVLVS